MERECTYSTSSPKEQREVERREEGNDRAHVPHSLIIHSTSSFSPKERGESEIERKIPTSRVIFLGAASA